LAYTYYDRLSAMDAMFLEIEDAQTHMHMGAVGIYEVGPLREPGGGLDFERVRDFAESQLHKNPRFRQRIEWIPTFDRPVWVDDANFKLTYHLRHTALPHPGDVRQLKRMVGRILSQKLDVGKPLWEIWVIEGVEGDRFALLSKVHHCVADGVAGTDLLNMLMGTNPNYEPQQRAHPWKPRKAPPRRRLMLDEALRQAGAPLAMLRGTAESAGKPSGNVLDRALEALRGAVHAAETGLRPVSATPLNTELGPHRRFDWTQFDLAEVRRVGKSAGGTVNDAALAIVAGAARRYLLDRAGAVDGLEFRVAVPVNMRSSDDDGRLGNRASSMVVTLPLSEKEPRDRLARIVEMTGEIKRSGESQAVDLLSRLADFLLRRSPSTCWGRACWPRTRCCR
jgi:WS/DGAT/MGAT family acyltransferase